MHNKSVVWVGALPCIGVRACGVLLAHGGNPNGNVKNPKQANWDVRAIQKLK